ncbi:hypothetical protein BUALT_Bualt03G0024300 [Buddleja alternifolia]|uniref:Major facilitator superfamily (MFS) profile domain-containing protein n=1 Tax=Buddleja alternifolia TaxID=168488 RepID=A0AAV6Y1F5_9LAMI|nr:hypothetical protein BUALT_Bualt03G0024300 [Buddleja alternifolia]
MESKTYPGKLTREVFNICLVAGNGGLLFGYDIGISGGVTSMPAFLEKFFPHVYHKEQSYVPGTDPYCRFNDANLTFFTSSFYLAGFVSCLIASSVTRLFGRKCSMLLGGLIFLSGAIVNGLAKDISILIVGRFLLGFGVGFVNQSMPIYLSEIAPYKYRGGFNTLFQLSIAIGFLCANLLNYFTSKFEKVEGWRVSLGCAAIPAVMFIIGVICLPETTNSLIERGKQDEALTNLRKIRGVDDVSEELNDLVTASNASSKIDNPWSEILKRKYRPQLSLVTCIPIFQQMSGMNVFMFFAPVFLKVIGFGDESSLMSAVILGMVNCIATIVSIFTVDTFGRRALFIVGGIQMFICQLHLFILCCVLMLLMTIFIMELFPETKGIPIEKMSDIWRSHRYWNKFVAQEEDNAKVDNQRYVNKKYVPKETKVNRSSLPYFKKFVPADGDTNTEIYLYSKRKNVPMGI